MMGLAVILTLLAILSGRVDFSFVAEHVWFAELPAGCARDMLFGAGLCTGLTVASAIAWVAVVARPLLG